MLDERMLVLCSGCGAVYSYSCLYRYTGGGGLYTVCPICRGRTPLEG